MCFDGFEYRRFFVFEGIENSVDHSAGGVVGKSFGEFDRFVDAYFFRNGFGGEVEHLVRCDHNREQVSNRHTRYVELRRVFMDDSEEFRFFLHDSRKHRPKIGDIERINICLIEKSREKRLFIK